LLSVMIGGGGEVFYAAGRNSRMRGFRFVWGGWKGRTGAYGGLEKGGGLVGVGEGKGCSLFGVEKKKKSKRTGIGALKRIGFRGERGTRAFLKHKGGSPEVGDQVGVGGGKLTGRQERPHRE